MNYNLKLNNIEEEARISFLVFLIFILDELK